MNIELWTPERIAEAKRRHADATWVLEDNRKCIACRGRRTEFLTGGDCIRCQGTGLELHSVASAALDQVRWSLDQIESLQTALTQAQEQVRVAKEALKAIDEAEFIAPEWKAGAALARIAELEKKPITPEEKSV